MTHCATLVATTTLQRSSNEWQKMSYWSYLHHSYIITLPCLYYLDTQKGDADWLWHVFDRHI